MAQSMVASATELRKHWRMLGETIGNRQAGSDEEQQAANYIEKQFKRFGLANIHQHRFDFPNSTSVTHTAKVAVRGGTWRNLKSGPFTYSADTATKGVTGALAYLEDGSPLNFKQNLKGKVGVLIGSLSLVDEELKQRLRQSKLAALLAVDARTPHNWRVPAGAAPQWMQNYDLPTVGIPFLEATTLLRQMPLKANVTVKSRTFPDTSQNVIGEVVGRKHPDQVIIVCGHHDCVWGTVGADDNGSGVIFTLELARLFAKTRPLRTIRFISYGVEERLSVGAYAYFRSLTPRQRKELIFCLNADGIADHLGPDLVRVTGNPGVEKIIAHHWQRCGHPTQVQTELSPFSDHIAANFSGAPSVFLGRSGLSWKLHSVHDNLDNVSVPVISRTIQTSAKLLKKIANTQHLPFRSKLSPHVQRQVQAMAKKFYHHPWSPQQFR